MQLNRISKTFKAIENTKRSKEIEAGTAHIRKGGNDGGGGEGGGGGGGEGGDGRGGRRHRELGASVGAADAASGGEGNWDGQEELPVSPLVSLGMEVRTQHLQRQSEVQQQMIERHEEEQRQQCQLLSCEKVRSQKEEARQLMQAVLTKLTVLEKHCEEAAKREQEAVLRQQEAVAKEEKSRQQEAARNVVADQAAAAQAAAHKADIMDAIRELAHDMRLQHVSITKQVLTQGRLIELQNQRLSDLEAVRGPASTNPASRPLNRGVFGDHINRGEVNLDGGGGVLAAQAEPLRSGLLPPVELVMSHRPIANLRFDISEQCDGVGHATGASNGDHTEDESSGERAQAQTQSLRQKLDFISASSPFHELGHNMIVRIVCVHENVGVSPISALAQNVFVSARARAHARTCMCASVRMHMKCPRERERRDCVCACACLSVSG